MPNYIILGHFTEKGIATIKEAPARLDAVKESFRSAGGQLKGFYLVTGQYDFVCLVEAPNDETLAKVVLSAGSRGTARTETLRAFNEEEYRKIVSGLA